MDSENIDLSIYDACRAYMLYYYNTKNVIVHGDSYIIFNNIIKNTSEIDNTRFVILVKNELQNKDMDVFDIEDWVLSIIKDGFDNYSDINNHVANTMLFMREFITYMYKYKNKVMIHSIIDKVALTLSDPKYKNELLNNKDKDKDTKEITNYSFDLIDNIICGVFISGLLYCVFNWLYIQ
ncbi:ankyrin-like protein [Yokapox virus]|uniref:Ankyrin-like protein n=1 Tax=Yokapox virus TaxID=1076255 RepID=G3EI54_9POXV|nr:ankyrin-like protein [Yokapox virus]AEN03751.1 ankyrin-like protein [Yokapox virus]